MSLTVGGGQREGERKNDTQGAGLTGLHRPPTLSVEILSSSRRRGEFTSPDSTVHSDSKSLLSRTGAKDTGREVCFLGKEVCLKRKEVASEYIKQIWGWQEQVSDC